MQPGETRVILQRVAGVVIIPAPDPITDAFMNDLRATILDYMKKNKISGVIIDLSGVELLDGHDFENLRQVRNGIELMGAPVILAGIRPGVAAGLAALNADDGWVWPSRSVEAAMGMLR